MTKVPKSHSKYMELNSWVSTVMKNVNNSRRTNDAFMKINLQVISNLLNNFQLIMKVDLLWPKCSNHALNSWNGKKLNSWVSTVMKNVNNSRRTNDTFMKINLKVVSNPLNNFQLIEKVDFPWPKCSNYALNIWNGKKIKFVS